MNNRIDWMNLTRQFEANKDEYMNAIESVCNQTAFSGGQFVCEFEELFASFLGVEGFSAVNSGTSALFLAMKTLGISEGDEVIVPADTFIASAWGASHNGAKPVFVDINPETFEIDVTKIEENITKNTKAIVGVHLYGQPFDVDSVNEIARKYGLYVIEDCAQAHGARYKGKRVGALSDMGCFSFYPGKNLGAFGEGGGVASNTPEYIERINVLKEHGAKVRYYHDEIGYNMRMEGIQGAILTTKLKYLDEWSDRRREIASMYLEGIKNPRIKMQMQPEWAESVFHLFVVEVENRERFLSFLDERGISCGQHYPIPCHLQKAYESLGYEEGDLPVAEHHAKHCVSLPMFPELRDDEVKRVIEVCNEWK